MGLIGNALKNSQAKYATQSSQQTGGDLKSKFRSNNGVWDQLDTSNDLVKNLIYKLRLALGISWNPIIEKVYKISPPFAVK
jgi:hypothetical protein